MWAGMAISSATSFLLLSKDLWRFLSARSSLEMVLLTGGIAPSVGRNFFAAKWHERLRVVGLRKT
jgi:hypothetical protein